LPASACKLGLKFLHGASDKGAALFNIDHLVKRGCNRDYARMRLLSLAAKRTGSASHRNIIAAGLTRDQLGHTLHPAHRDHRV
jgi:hypothetical protein